MDTKIWIYGGGGKQQSVLSKTNVDNGKHS